MALIPINNVSAALTLTSESIEALSDDIVERAAGIDNEDFHVMVGNLQKVLRRCAEKKPLIKHIIFSYHTGGADPIQLIFDDDPTIAPTHENFIRAETIKLTDSGGAEETIKYEGDLEIFADFEEGVRKMAIRYAGGFFVFTDRYSLVRWNCPAAHLFHNVKIFLAW
jgi:hypothetical protein